MRPIREPVKEALNRDETSSDSLPALNSECLKRDVIVVGASAGGVQALMELLASLPADLPATVSIVLHRGSMPGHLADVLGRRSTLPIIEPSDERQVAKPGTVYLAPADRHLIFGDHGLISHRGPKEHSTRPAVDPLFRSAAALYGKRVVGVVLTGAGDDGVSGLIAITKAGGLALTQDPVEAPMPYMPLYALRHDHVARVFPLKEFGPALTALASGKSFQGGCDPDQRVHTLWPW